ncbi:hypothetical protein FWK35_00013538 [Aphis craccivora]|uniref:Uncharacterized protein n=1 Tax=Aphis craccivora TaxID=307492 RepID=A0A6G0Z152_APHCR|nr:hypothetical protein FWK35_00013538 [Aphis craccivora]
MSTFFSVEYMNIFVCLKNINTSLQWSQYCIILQLQLPTPVSKRVYNTIILYCIAGVIHPHQNGKEKNY